MPIAFITGATSGFGKAIAERFAKEKYAIIISARRGELLLAEADRLRSSYGISVLPLNFDVRDRRAVEDSVAALEGEWKAIDVLVNNAGLALGRSFFEEADADDWETMIDTNIKGVLYMSRAVVKLMIDGGHGHIINIGSIAGIQAYEKGNVYCASKAAVDSLSQGMRIDLLRHRIKVTAIHPGAAETEFSLVRFKGNAEAAKSVYAGYMPLTAEDIADAVWYCASLPPHVCINELVITPTAQADAFHLHRG